MPGIAPIQQALMYARSPAGGCADLSSRLAPPYDVVTSALRTQLLKADALNSCAIDLPQLPIDRVGPREGYARARSLLESWLGRGALAPCDRPVYGLLRQTFRDRGSIARRHAIFADVPLVPLGRSAGLYAHEETDSGPRGDRLALLQALRVQTSPIFGIYSDDEGAVEEQIRHRLIRDEPRAVGVSPDGTLSELWLVEREAEVNRLTAAFGSRDVIIADGHHRYASQVAYLESLGGAAPRAARACMMALVAHQDAGMAIRPLHHVYGGMENYSLEKLLKELGDLFRIEETAGTEADLECHVFRAWFERSIPMGLVDFESGRCFVISTREVDPLAQNAPEAPEAWRRAAPVVCRRLVVDRVLRDWCNVGRDPLQRAVAEIPEMRRADGPLDRPQVGIVMLPLRLEDVLAIAAGGFLLPADSTFFWPKIPTGLLFKSLE